MRFLDDRVIQFLGKFSSKRGFEGRGCGVLAELCEQGQFLPEDALASFVESTAGRLFVFYVSSSSTNSDLDRSVDAAIIICFW